MASWKLQYKNLKQISKKQFLSVDIVLTGNVCYKPMK